MGAIICDCPKSREQYAAQNKNGGPATVAEDSEGEKRPRGKTNSKLDEKRHAATFALQETLQGFMTQKEAREGRKRQEKEEQMKAYIEIQNKNVEFKVTNPKQKGWHSC